MRVYDRDRGQDGREPGADQPGHGIRWVKVTAGPRPRRQDQGQHQGSDLKQDPGAAPPAIGRGTQARDPEREDSPHHPCRQRGQRPGPDGGGPAGEQEQEHRDPDRQAAPTAITRLTRTGISSSALVPGTSRRRLAHQTPKTRKGVVKYSPAHSQKATCEWVNLPQCRIVATPIKVAKVPTGTKPPLTVCHCLAVAARRKK